MSLFPEVDKECEEIKRAEQATIQKIKDESEMYMPSNGTEGVLFECDYCDKCSKEDCNNEKFCRILSGLYAGVKHEDLIEYKEEIICFQSSKFNLKEFLKGLIAVVKSDYDKTDVPNQQHNKQ